MTFLRDKYVINHDRMEFDPQSWDGVTDITSQNLIAIKCMYDGILQSFENLVAGLAFTPGGLGLQYTGTVDLIKDYEYLNLSWDEVRVVCQGDAVVNMQLYALAHDKCEDEKDKPKKPPPPLPPPEKVPPGTPFTDISPPYDSQENPDNFTEPYPDDTTTPSDFPLGEPETKYLVSIRVYGNWAEPDGVEATKGKYADFDLTVWGEIYSIQTNRSQPAVYVDCHGDGNSPIGERQLVQVIAGEPSGPQYGDAELLTYQEIPA